MARLLSVNVGLPRDIAWKGKTVHTSVWKAPVRGARMVRRLNVDGDAQGDTAGHGGEHRAVFVYQAGSYDYWAAHLSRHDFLSGQFGENFTVDGMSDIEVCIGDHYRIGRALFEVTQPRVTCYRIGIRMDVPEMAALLVAHGRPGFYLRVLEEGEVEAGDEIVKVASGPERMSVSEINALLYKPGHPLDRIERALHIPALSPGWQRSFRALLTEKRKDGPTTGNAGLFGKAAPPTAWPGFHPFRLASKTRESKDVISLELETADGLPAWPAQAGQYVVLRLERGPVPALMRSYSLSGEPGAPRYRVSIKRETHGVASGYIHDVLKVGDTLGVSAPRGVFTLQPADKPIVFMSAGIGATPVLAMLKALATEGSTRQVWWVHGARNGRGHPFAEETRVLLGVITHSHRHIRYSSPDSEDQPGIDFDAQGRIDKEAVLALNLPRDADFYLCGPPSFMSDLTAYLTDVAVAPDHIRTEIFGSAPTSAPGVAPVHTKPPHAPSAVSSSGPVVSFSRSGLDVRWGPDFSSLLDLAEACDVPVRWSCRTGVCHNCETGLVAGSVSYRPVPLDAPADGNLLICCSQPTSDIVIDL